MSTISGTGLSENIKDSFAAGREAARTAMDFAQLHDKPSLVVVFATEQFDEVQLLAGVQSVTKDAPLVGCTVPGVMVNDAVSQEGVGVAVLYSDSFEVQAALAEHLSDDATRAGTYFAEQLLPKREGVRMEVNRQTVFLLADASLTRAVVSDALAAAYKTLGAFYRFVGGGSSDMLHFKKSFQFFNGKVYKDSLVGFVIVSKTAQAVELKHGWLPTSKNFVVTKSDGKIVHELDNKPALQVYMEFRGQEISGFDFSKFYNFAMDHPLGIPATNEEYVIRDPLSASPDDNSITFVSEVPQDSIVRIMEGTKQSVIDASRTAGEKAKTALGESDSTLIIVADCVSRLLLLGDQAGEEIHNIRHAIGDHTPLLGFFSFGEVGIEKGGPPAFCNKACVIYALPSS